MTGRLVILRHKSWHVWNQDNQEKVFRDERLQKEAAGEKITKQRKLNQDFATETLKARLPVDPEKNEHINLFEDTSVESLQNKDYLKEKEEKKQLELKHAGIAPLAFGAGSSKKTPWYGRLSSSSSSDAVPASSGRPWTNSGPPACPNRNGAKEEHRKSLIDPMFKIVKSIRAPPPSNPPSLSQDGHMGNGNIASGSSVSSSAGFNGNEIGDSGVSARGKKGEGKRERESTTKLSSSHSRHSHHHKQSHSHKSSRRSSHSPSHDSHKASEGHDTITAVSDSSAVMSVVNIAEMRKRRLERERSEHSREARLLTTHDIYGPNC